jgi:hypothetical protein
MPVYREKTRSIKSLGIPSPIAIGSKFAKTIRPAIHAGLPAVAKALHEGFAGSFCEGFACSFCRRRPAMTP